MGDIFIMLLKTLLYCECCVVNTFFFILRKYTWNWTIFRVE